MRAAEWKDYSVIATGDGYKLERWADVVLLRPDPQVIWKPSIDMNGYKGLSAKYIRSETGGGKWIIKGKMPQEWTVSYKDLKFKIKPMGLSGYHHASQAGSGIRNLHRGPAGTEAGGGSRRGDRHTGNGSG